MISAIIYDMDGIIIDSEPLWWKAEIASFATVGLKATEAMCQQTMGMRIDEVVKHWFDRYPLDPAKAKSVENLIMENVISLVKEEGKAMKGVVESLQFFKSLGLEIGLASSSRMNLINTVLDKLQIRDFFSTVHSAEFEVFGKPHPGVYMTAAEQLKVASTKCLALEDSINGMISAKAARMKCIGIPEGETLKDARISIADCVIPSLAKIDAPFWSDFLKSQG